MRDADTTFDAMRLQGTSLDVNLALRRLRRGAGPLRDEDRAAFADAYGFIERARRGQVTRRTRRLSATPLRDLLALRYAEAAQPATRPASNAELEPTLADLARSLHTLAQGDELPRDSVWTLEQIDAFFERMFWVAAGMAAQPTDITRRSGPSTLTTVVVTD